jgi:hypothetical protein
MKRKLSARLTRCFPAALVTATPMGLNGNAPDYGVFLYLSFEHGFGAKQ